MLRALVDLFLFLWWAVVNFCVLLHFMGAELLGCRCRYVEGAMSPLPGPPATGACMQGWSQ